MPGSLVDIFQVITLSGRPSEWTKQETGQRVTHCSCALLPWLMWLGSLYFELYCQAVCTWKPWHLPLSWFESERIRLNLINPKVLKVEHGLHVKMLDSVRNHLLPKKCNEIIHHSRDIFLGARQLRTLSNSCKMPNHSHRVLRGRSFSKGKI